MALFLREQGIERVIIAGVKTNVCIRATVQDAFANGFLVVVPREATNSNRPHLAAASLEDIERYFGDVVPLDAAQIRLQGRGVPAEIVQTLPYVIVIVVLTGLGFADRRALRGSAF